MELMQLLSQYLIWGVAGMFLTLAGICGLGAIIYPFYIIWTGFRDKLL